MSRSGPSKVKWTRFRTDLISHRNDHTAGVPENRHKHEQPPETLILQAFQVT